MFRMELAADGYKQGCFMRIESLRAIPQYAREYQFEVKAFAVGATASLLALRYFGKVEALGIAGLAYLAYQYRDRISLISESAQNPQFLALLGATASLPFIASVPVIGIKLAIPIAASLSLALLRYEMEQRCTINGLVQNNKELEKGVKACDEATALANKNNVKQTQIIDALTDLYTTMVKNTDRLKQISEEDTTLQLTAAFKLLGELFTQVKEGDLAKTIHQASELKREKVECEDSLNRSEKKKEDFCGILNRSHTLSDEARHLLEELRQTNAQPVE